MAVGTAHWVVSVDVTKLLTFISFEDPVDVKFLVANFDPSCHFLPAGLTRYIISGTLMIL